MAAVNYPITGPPVPSPAPADGSVPLRLEVRNLQNNHPDQWNLYLLGLQAFYKLDEASDLSFYGIAGIHGRPYREWGGVEGTNSPTWGGYCTHTSILFAPWHRPYVSLFEQVLYSLIQDIASTFPDSTRIRYQQAASTFRVPYWDWAAQPPSGDQYFPLSVGGSATVNVITPQSDGQTISIPNPLYSYKFAPLNPEKGDFVEDDGVPYNRWPTTLRYPSSQRSINAKSQESQVFDAMQSQFSSLQSNVNILMNDPNYKDFAAFSNHIWESDPGTFASLEDVHNTIHSEVGGNAGHMSELDYAAFDPVFWLHHANVDRLFAIWQALNPTSYDINEQSGSGTFVISSNGIETDTTPLAPFNDASGRKFYNSQVVRSTETFNYAYPETQRWSFSSDNDYLESVQKAVDELYGSISGQAASDLMTASAALPATPIIKEKVVHDSTQKPSSTSGAPVHSSSPIHVTSTSVSGHSPELNENFRGLNLGSEIGQAPTLPLSPQPSKYTEYICNIKTPKHLFHQTYRVHIFLGEFNNDTTTWHTQDTLVGTFAAFGKNPITTGCGKCKDDEKSQVIITGTVPLTRALIDEYKKGNLKSLGQESVLPYLTKHLHWRVTLADGTDKPREEVAGLKVSVVTTDVDLPVDGRPRFSGIYVVHPEVTEGRPAGHGENDQV